MIVYDYKTSEIDADILYYAYEKEVVRKKEIARVETRNMPDYIQLFDVFVEKEYRRRGIGKTLIQKLIKQAKEKENVKYISVFPHPTEDVSIEDVNTFYLCAGFKPVDENFASNKMNQEMRIYI